MISSSSIQTLQPKTKPFNESSISSESSIVKTSHPRPLTPPHTPPKPSANASKRMKFEESALMIPLNNAIKNAVSMIRKRIES